MVLSILVGIHRFHGMFFHFYIIFVALYPKELPELNALEGFNIFGLKEHLISEIGDLIGSPFLYTMVESVKEWLQCKLLKLDMNDQWKLEDSGCVVQYKGTKNLVKGGSDIELPEKLHQNHRINEQHEHQIIENSGKAVQQIETHKKLEVCRFFLQKKCKFGNKCHNLHPGQITQAQTTESISKSELKLSCDSTTQAPMQKKEKSTDQDTQGSKKAPLRQAADVISRILWDPDLKTEDFTIGYLDRFTGIIEKPFMAFSWEDIASVGQNVLAVPKHRIQYFKYKDEIIWDKRSQLDNVFGSRGGRVITDIVPPSKSATSSDGDKGETGANHSLSKPQAEIKLVEDDAPIGKVGYNDKDRPTHFVCIKIHNSQVLAKVERVLHYIRSCAPDLAVGCLSLGALHVTLCMLRIESEKQSLAAQEVLRNLQRSFVHILPPSTQLEFTGVSNFHGRLLYAKVAPHHGLNKAVSMLIEGLQNAGIGTPGNFSEYTPHMTLLKLSRPMQREAHTATIAPALYSKFTNMHLGTQNIDTLYLCSTSGPKVNGFYETLKTLPFSLACLPSSFASIISDQIRHFVDQGIIKPAEGESLVEPLNGPEIHKNGEILDHAIKTLEKLNSEKSTMMNHSSYVIILRGVPGSGKSYLASHCSEYLDDPSQVAVCSADHYFTNNSEYSFSSSELHKAHLHCFDHFLSGVLERKRMIIIDNTNSQLWEYQFYIYVCSLLALPHSILEVPCLDTHMLEMYRSRCVHKLDPTASLNMYERWQKDKDAVIVPPRFSYPGLRKLEGNESFSIMSMCHPSTDLVDSVEPLTAHYNAIFLTNESQWLLLNTFHPAHPEILADHVTLSFEPTLQSLLHTKIGKHVKVKVISMVDDKNVQAAVVVLPRGLSSENRIPHITLSKESHAFAKDSNKLLDCRKYIPMKDKEMILDGIIGVTVGKVEENDKSHRQVILSSIDYHKILPRLTVNNESIRHEMLSQNQPSICTGAQKITQLFVFDFDLTLFNSANPSDGREIYERLTGKKWPHRGWLGHPDSLMPPLSVHPGPALADYCDHQGRAGSLTVVVTARIERTRKAVERVLEEAQVHPDAVYCKPDSSSDSETSAQYKVRVIEKLIAENTDVTLVKFWDDNLGNLTAVRDIADRHRSIHIEVVNASRIIPKKQDSILYTDLVQRGCHLSALYNSAAAEGVNFLSSQYCRMIGYVGNPKDVCHVYGSYPIGRRSDVDMCCLVQSPASAFDSIDKFAEQLEDCGITYIHKGKSSRCPRLKVKLVFDSAPPVEYDIVFAVVENDLTTLQKLSSSSSRQSILSSLKPCDSRSKVALTGPNFLQQVIETIDGKISVGEFGAVVETAVQILRSFRQKGNAYHCIRTFHVVRLLLEYIRSPKFSQLKDSNCDELFRNFMCSVSEIHPAKWQKLFGEFVPKEYIPRVINVFTTIADKLSDIPADKPFPNLVFYSDYNARPSFPPTGYSSVSLCLHGSSKSSLWKLATLVEARLQTCIRKLLDAGIDIVPNGNECYEKFCFAVPQSDIGSSVFKTNLKHLTDELSVHEQEPLAYFKVHIIS